MQSPYDKLKNRLKNSSCYPFLSYLKGFTQIRHRRLAKAHKLLHDNQLFYTLSPDLLIAIAKSFKMQQKSLLQYHGYYEFGLFKGFSFWFAEKLSREYCNEDFILYGFDSFEGLSKSSVDIETKCWAEGNYACSYQNVMDNLRNYGTDFSRIKMFKGFFSKELFNSLRVNESFLPCSICVIDSDIYEACVEALDFIKDFMVSGTILLFDDFNAFNRDDSHGERRALREFEEKNSNFQKEYLFDFGGHGVAFRVTEI